MNSSGMPAQRQAAVLPSASGRRRATTTRAALIAAARVPASSRGGQLTAVTLGH